MAKLPEGISTRDAATVLTQGLTGALHWTSSQPLGASRSEADGGIARRTALTFVKEAHEVKPGQFILVQAAAGGLGLLLVQLAKAIGATVIGTTSTPEKAELAKKAGADHVVLYGEGRDVVGEIYKITGGGEPLHPAHSTKRLSAKQCCLQGEEGIEHGVGKDTFEIDFELLRRQAPARFS